MVKAMANKKHLVASFHNLSPELQEEIKQKYPLGFTDAMIRVDKPNGDFFYAVPYDTDEISYLVKIDVKICPKTRRRRSITTTRSRAPTTSRRRAPRRRRRRTTTWKSDGRCCRCATRLSERTVGFFIAAADGVPNGCAPCGRRPDSAGGTAENPNGGGPAFSALALQGEGIAGARRQSAGSSGFLTIC